MTTAIFVAVLSSAILIIFLAAYYRGKKDERDATLAESVDALVESQAAQEKREVAHDARVQSISSGHVDAADAERMLSSWNDKGGASQ